MNNDSISAVSPQYLSQFIIIPNPESYTNPIEGSTPHELRLADLTTATDFWPKIQSDMWYFALWVSSCSPFYLVVILSTFLKARFYTNFAMQNKINFNYKFVMQKKQNTEDGNTQDVEEWAEGDNKAAEGDNKAVEGDNKAVEGDNKAAEGDNKVVEEYQKVGVAESSHCMEG